MKSFRLDDWTQEMLEGEASWLGISQTEVLQLAVRAFVEWNVGENLKFVFGRDAAEKYMAAVSAPQDSLLYDSIRDTFEDFEMAHDSSRWSAVKL